MPRGVLFGIIGLAALLIIVALVLNAYIGGMKSTGRQSPVDIDTALSPRPGQQEQASPRITPSPTVALPSPAPSAPTSVLADDTRQVPRPEPPRVEAITGSWGRNPFLTSEEIDFLRNPRKYDVEPEPPPVRLSTILTVNGKRTAALNGHYVTIGDLIGSEKVIRITEYALTLQRENGKTREIKLHDPIIDLKSRSRR